MKMNLTEDSASIGEPFSKHARKARGITSTKIFCDMFNKLLMTSVGPLISLSLMTSLRQRKTRLLALTDFPTMPTSVLVARVRSSSFVLTKVSWEGSAILDCFAESRTVFIPKT